MTDLRLPIDGTDFERLVELGRSMIPTVAPEWTDHNIHDPGIMLIELMAWIADAQVYSLSRLRRDERQAYARLLGVSLRGPRPAQGLIWPLAAEAPASTPLPWPAGTTIARGTAVTGTYPNAPAFFTTHSTELTSARLTGLSTRFADGSTRDWTRANSREGATFMPFGDAPARGDRLVLSLRGALTQGSAPDAFISIGVELAAGSLPESSTTARAAGPRSPQLRLSLRDTAGERPLELAEDTTNGLLESGVLLVRVGASARPVDESFEVTIASPSGELLRPPRVQRIGVNVIPISQLEAVAEESATFGTGLPDQVYELLRPGLVFPFEKGAFTARIFEDGGWQSWSIEPDVQRLGPGDRGFTLDRSTGVLQFGNGVNGRVPPAGAPLQLEYQVTEGLAGNLPKDIPWTVRGIAGEFGINSEPTSGGASGQTLDSLRSLARRRSREARPIVTSADLESAALAFHDLEVTRALELGGATSRRVRGTRVLVAVDKPPAETAEEDETAPARPRWLDEIRARLSPRLPLGQRLEVIPPRYVDVRITARLVAARNTDPAHVKARAEKDLRRRLAIVSDEPGESGWPFGRDVTAAAIKGWLRKVQGVAKVIDVRLFEGDVERAERFIPLGSIGLPRLHLAAGDIIVERPPLGGAR